ncbi:MAG: class II aldolase/adducin family protein [Candidatus Thermoplasmatota archaeon]|nr:class II aldolase/adducin family protein [Candidatus Thermoplasmatota archaeon]
MDDIKDILDIIISVSSSVNEKGWGEGSTGNLSVLITGPLNSPGASSDHFETGLFLPQLEKKYILISRSGSRFQDISSEPEENLGLYRVEGGGETVSLIWGAGVPSSEWLVHLLLYAYKGRRINSILHCHMDEVFDVESYIKGPASTHPDWVAWLPGIPFGTLELARVTLQEIEGREIAFWKGHGILSVSSDLESALNNIQRFSEWSSTVTCDQ